MPTSPFSLSSLRDAIRHPATPPAGAATRRIDANRGVSTELGAGTAGAHRTAMASLYGALDATFGRFRNEKNLNEEDDAATKTPSDADKNLDAAHTAFIRSLTRWRNRGVNEGHGRSDPTADVSCGSGSEAWEREWEQTINLELLRQAETVTEGVGKLSEDQLVAGKRRDYGENPIAELFVFRRVLSSLLIKSKNQFKRRTDREPQDEDELVVSSMDIHRELSVGAGRNSTSGKYLYPYNGIEAEVLYHSSVVLWLKEKIYEHDCPAIFKTLLGRDASSYGVKRGDYFVFPYGKTRLWLKETVKKLPPAWIEAEEADYHSLLSRSFIEGEVVMRKDTPWIVLEVNHKHNAALIKKLGLPSVSTERNEWVKADDVTPFSSVRYRDAKSKTEFGSDAYFALLQAKDIVETLNALAQEERKDIIASFKNFAVKRKLDQVTIDTIDETHVANVEKAAKRVAQVVAKNSENTTGEETIKKGAWTLEEHRLFIEGLCHEGHGAWDAISKKYFRGSRTPKQVADHWRSVQRRWLLINTGKVNEKQTRRRVYKNR